MVSSEWPAGSSGHTGAVTAEQALGTWVYSLMFKFTCGGGCVMAGPRVCPWRFPKWTWTLQVCGFSNVFLQMDPHEFWREKELTISWAQNYTWPPWVSHRPENICLGLSCAQCFSRKPAGSFLQQGFVKRPPINDQVQCHRRQSWTNFSSDGKEHFTLHPKCVCRAGWGRPNTLTVKSH